MARTANPERPDALLDSIVEYLMTHGVADVSLRPLAKAVRSSPRVLLYYFGSKEALVAQALARLRERQRGAFARLKQSPTLNSRQACHAIWRELSSPHAEPLFRLFLQAYSMGLQNREKFAAFLHHAIEDWLEFLAAPRIASGESPVAARAFATVVLAGFRGFMLDYCASHNRRRVDAAVELWLESLDALAPGARRARRPREG
jgi:AcrR family transcriptional regulator